MIKARENKIPLKQSVMFLLFSNGKFLLEKRKDPDGSYFNYSIIPAGKLEENELPEEGLRREILEETGVVPTKFTMLDTFEDVTPKGHHYLVNAYLITEFEGSVVNREPYKVDHEWVTLEETRNILKFANSRYVFLLAERALNAEEQKKD